MCHEMLTQRAFFRHHAKKGHTESAFRDACRTSSAPLATCDQNGTNMPPSPKKWGGGGSTAKVDIAIMACPLFYQMAHYSISSTPRTLLHTHSDTYHRWS